MMRVLSDLAMSASMAIYRAICVECGLLILPWQKGHPKRHVACAHASWARIAERARDQLGATGDWKCPDCEWRP